MSTPDQKPQPHEEAVAEDSQQQQTHAPSAGKLFVGQVPAVCTEDMLRPVFQPFGQIIEIKIMRDAPGGRSKGCAWVKYATREQAQAAIDSLHEQHTIPPQTNTLQVRFAEEKGARASQQQQQLAQQQADMSMSNMGSATAFVGNLPANTPAETLRDFIVPLLPTGVSVKEVNVPSGKLFGFLTFETAGECHAAVAQLTASPPTLNGNLLRVQSARPRVNNRDMAAMMMGANPYGRGGFPMMPTMDPMFFGRGGYPGGFGGAPYMNPYMGMGPSFGYGGMPPMGYGGGGGGGSGGQRNGGGGRGRGGSWNR